MHMWHDSFICDMTYFFVPCLMHMWHVSSICDMSHAYMPWLIHMWHVRFICDVTHSYVTWPIHIDWYDSFLCATTNSNWLIWLIHMCHDPFTLIDTTHSYVPRPIHIDWYDSFICAMTHSHWWIWLIHMCHVPFMCDMSHANLICLLHISHVAFICDMTQSHLTWFVHMWRKYQRRSHCRLDFHLDPLTFIIPPPSNRTTPSSSPARPSSHDTHASTTRCTSSPGIVTYSQSLPLSAAGGILPCCRRELLWLPPLPDKAVGAALPSRACVPMAKARACIGGRSWQRPAREPYSRSGVMCVGTNFVCLSACPRHSALPQV